MFPLLKTRFFRSRVTSHTRSKWGGYLTITVPTGENAQLFYKDGSDPDDKLVSEIMKGNHSIAGASGNLFVYTVPENKYGWYFVTVTGATSAVTVKNTFEQTGQASTIPWNGWYWPTLSTQNPNLYEETGTWTPLKDYDQVYGADNDNDGRLDEDPPGDKNGDNAPGVKDVDDDGDGKVDEDSQGLEPGNTPEADQTNDIDDDGDGVIDDNGYLDNRDSDDDEDNQVDEDDYDSKTRQWEDANHSGGAGWEGHCWGWAIAAIAKSQPAATTKKDALGNNVDFNQDEMEGLYTELADNASNWGHWVIGSYPSDEIPPNGSDAWPKILHDGLRKYLRQDQIALTADLRGTSNPSEVWNHPVYKYESIMEEASSGDKFKIKITTTITAGIDFPAMPPDGATRQETYTYQVKYEANGEIGTSDQKWIDCSHYAPSEASINWHSNAGVTKTKVDNLY